MIAPARTDPATVSKLHDSVARVLALPATVENFAATGSRTGGGTTREFAHYIALERQKWGNVIRTANIKAD